MSYLPKTYRDRKEIKIRINECIDSILSTQMQNGRWDNNLGKTARLLVFLSHISRRTSLIEKKRN